MKKLIMRIACGMYGAEMYLASYREDWVAFQQASDMASQLKFKIKWG